MKVIIRNNKLYIHYTDNKNKLVRFSTKIAASKSNFKYVNANIRDFIKNYEYEQKLAKESFAEYVEKYLTLEQVGKKDITNENSARIFKNHITPYFKTLKDLNYENVKKFIYDLNEKDICNNFKKVIANKLKAIVDEAMQSELIKPFCFPKTKFVNQNVKLSISDKVLNQDELQEIINSCKDDYLKQIIILKCFTGIRNGELIALKWEDIDFENEKIIIKANVSLGKITTTKTNRIRVVDMLPPTKEALRILKENYHFGEFVLTSKHTKRRYTSSSALVKRFKDYLKANDFKELKFYWTRHIFATLCLSKDIPIDWISKTLGHSKINTTLSFYATYVEDKERLNTIKNSFLSMC